MKKTISNYENYRISNNGQVFNSKGYKLKPIEFKNTTYIRLSKNGIRHTLSLNKLLFTQFDLVERQLPLDLNEVGIRYKDTHYYITNKLRCYNAKRRCFLKEVYRNGYVSYSLCSNGQKQVVYALKFIKKHLCPEGAI